MEKFRGKKYFVKDEYQVRNPEVWWTDEYIEKADFKMTKEYRKWLYERKKEKARIEVGMLKQRLKYEYEIYGEVDDLDFKEYQRKLKEYMEMK